MDSAAGTVKGRARRRTLFSLLACGLLSLLNLCLYLAAWIACVLFLFYLDLPDLAPLGDRARLPAVFQLEERGGESIRPLPPEAVPESLVLAFLAAGNPGYLSETRSYAEEMALTWWMLLARSGNFLYCGTHYEDMIARRMPLAPESRSYSRAISQSLLALKLGWTFSRREILHIHMNSVYLGYGKYGVEAASRWYFRKAALDLTVAEAALLAALSSAPSRCNPFTRPKNALERRNWLLKRMIDLAFISRQEYEKALAEALPPPPVPPEPPAP